MVFVGFACIYGRYQAFPSCTCWPLLVNVIRVEMKYYQPISTTRNEASDVMVIDVGACERSGRIAREVRWGKDRKSFGSDPHVYTLTGSTHRFFMISNDGTTFSQPVPDGAPGKQVDTNMGLSVLHLVALIRHMQRLTRVATVKHKYHTRCVNVSFEYVLVSYHATGSINFNLDLRPLVDDQSPVIFGFLMHVFVPSKTHRSITHPNIPICSCHIIDRSEIGVCFQDIGCVCGVRNGHF